MPVREILNNPRYIDRLRFEPQSELIKIVRYLTLKVEKKAGFGYEAGKIMQMNIVHWQKKQIPSASRFWRCSHSWWKE
jgi:hypothetical protein